MRKIITSIPVLLYFAFAVTSCQKTATGTGGTSDTTATTNYDFGAIDKILNDSVPVKFGGVCYALIHVNGKTVYSKSFGGYTGSTRKLIASCSKWLSGAALMTLVDEGKLSLDDTVGKFLPIFTTYKKGSITIRQLFSHTSGFPGDSPQGYEGNYTLTLAQCADSIAKNVALINTPGTKFYYGGVSMQVAGRICEVVSGKSWSDFFAAKITGPCGMASTDFSPLNPNAQIAGGAFSTADDYLKFLDMIMNNGVTASGTRVLSTAAIAAMEQSEIGSATVAYSPYPMVWLNTSGFYGIGNWRDLTAAGDVLVEDSSPGKFGSHPWVNRGKKLTGIIFTYLPAGGYLQTAPTCLAIRKAVRTIVQ